MSRSTRWDPRNPAPPTTKTFTWSRGTVDIRPTGARQAPTTPCRPTTHPSTAAPCPILPMTTEFATTAPASTTAPDNNTESVTVAPPPTVAPAATMLLLTFADRRPCASSCTPALPSGSALPAEQIQIGLQVQHGIARVEPVVVGGHREQAAVGHHLREGLALDRHPPTGRDAIEHRRLEHICAGVDLVARRRARRRLLDEPLDPAVGIDGDDAERRRVVDADQVHASPRPRARGGSRTSAADVEVGQHVAVGDDERVVDAAEVGGELDRTRRCRAAPARPRSAASRRRTCRRGTRR